MASDPGAQQPGPLDNFFRDINPILLWILGICTGVIGIVLAIIGMVTAKDDRAKKNATKLLIIGIVAPIVMIILYVVFIMCIFGGAIFTAAGAKGGGMILLP